jgi:hypothetical protein
MAGVPTLGEQRQRGDSEEEEKQLANRAAKFI